MAQNCELHSVADGATTITAQARENISDKSGFSFVSCKISGTGDAFLSRAWKPRSRVVFAYTYMGSLVDPLGWSDKGFPERQRYLSPLTLEQRHIVERVLSDNNHDSSHNTISCAPDAFWWRCRITSQVVCVVYWAFLILYFIIGQCTMESTNARDQVPRLKTAWAMERYWMIVKRGPSWARISSMVQHGFFLHQD